MSFNATLPPVLNGTDRVVTHTLAMVLLPEPEVTKVAMITLLRDTPTSGQTERATSIHSSDNNMLEDFYCIHLPLGTTSSRIEFC